MPLDGNVSNEADESLVIKHETNVEAVCLPPMADNEPVYGTVPPPFEAKPLDFHLPAEWTSGCVAELIEMLEGPMHK